MALVHFIESDFGRIEFDPATTGQEYRCDKCGRFIAPDLVIDLRVTTNDSDGVAATAASQVHKECAAAHAAQLAERVAEVLTA